MTEFINRKKKQSLLFLVFGILIMLISFQNFEYPEQISKTPVDLTQVLNTSETEIQNTKMNLQSVEKTALPVQTVTVSEPDAPIKIRLKRAPAKVISKKKKKLTDKAKLLAKKKKSKNKSKAPRP